MKTSLKYTILNYLNANVGWHKKVQLYIIGDEYGYSPESVARQLRSLAEDKQIRVDYYDGKYSKNLAKYASLSTEKPQAIKPQIVMKNGKLVAIY